MAGMLVPFVAQGYGDTIRLSDNSEVNGIVEFSKSSFLLQASTPSGKQTYPYSRDRVSFLEFNDRTTNQSAPPESVGTLKDHSDSYAEQAMSEAGKRSKQSSSSRKLDNAIDGFEDEQPLQDTLKMKDGLIFRGQLVEITASSVSMNIDGKTRSFRRAACRYVVPR